MEDPGKEFDPYAQWLKIPPEQQPPDHYTLLGLERFEGDSQKIDTAAKKRTAYLHQLAGGPNRKAVQQLLSEIATARRKLTNEESKSAYDQALMIPKTSENSGGFVPAIQISVDENAGKKRSKPTKKRAGEREVASGKQRKSQTGANTYMWVACGVLFALVVGLILFRSKGARRIAAEPSAPVTRQYPQSVQSKRENVFDSLASVSQVEEAAPKAIPKSAKAKRRRASRAAKNRSPANTPASVTPSSPAQKFVPVELSASQFKALPMLAGFSNNNTHPFTAEKYVAEHFAFEDERRVIVPRADSKKTVHLMLADQEIVPGQAVSIRTNFPVGNHRELRLGLSAGGIWLVLRPISIGKTNRIALTCAGKVVADFNKLGPADLTLTIYRSATDELHWFVSFRDESYGGRVKATRMTENQTVGFLYASPNNPMSVPLWVDELRLGPFTNPPDVSAAELFVIPPETDN